MTNPFQTPAFSLGPDVIRGDTCSNVSCPENYMCCLWNIIQWHLCLREINVVHIEVLDLLQFIHSRKQINVFWRWKLQVTKDQKEWEAFSLFIQTNKVCWASAVGSGFCGHLCEWVKEMKQRMRCVLGRYSAHYSAMWVKVHRKFNTKFRPITNLHLFQIKKLRSGCKE